MCREMAGDGGGWREVAAGCREVAGGGSWVKGGGGRRGREMVKVQRGGGRWAGDGREMGREMGGLT